MAEETKYQINGQLTDNTVTVDNREDMILVLVLRLEQVSCFIYINDDTAIPVSTEFCISGALFMTLS